jgi:cytoskeletal protein CcmA (bactofilin family)
METPKAPDAARGEMIVIGQSVVIKGELSCGEDLYIDGHVEGTIVNIHPSDRVDLRQSAIVMGDIATHRISIDEGAYFKGSLNIQKEATTKEVLGGTGRSSK